MGMILINSSNLLIISKYISCLPLESIGLKTEKHD